MSKTKSQPDYLIEKDRTVLSTVYQIGQKNIILLTDLLKLLKKDIQWFNTLYSDNKDDILNRYFFQLNDEQKWMFDGPDRHNSVGINDFAVTETGAFIIVANLEQADTADLSKLIINIFSQQPKTPETSIPEELFSNLNPLQEGLDEENLDENINYYHTILENTLAKNSIRNIAIAAPYGAGKSTVINSFFQNRPQLFDKAIYISLGTFDDDKQERQITQEYERQKVEKNILQQLIYQSDPEQLSESRILRIHERSAGTRSRGILELTVFLLAVCAVFIDEIFPTLKEDQYLSLIVVFKLMGIVAIALIIPPVIFDIFKTVRNIKISKFSTLAGEVELSHGKELSVFNQYMDELLYFFEKTPFRYVIIEDLDRFGDVEIFGRLRSLNQTLNKYPRLKERNIVFIYAMRDDIFAKDYRDRTKFFDLIIPIVPIINSSNSKDKFKALLTKDVIRSCKLDESFIDEVSEHIQDMRLLKNIVNEFFVHWQLLRGKYQYDGNELLAAIIYKNLVPADFAAYHENKGFLKQLKAFKKCLYDYADEKDPKILKDESDKKLEIGDIQLHTLINSLHEPLNLVRPTANKHFNTFLKKLDLDDYRATNKQQDNKQKDPFLYDTYLKSPIFLTLLSSGYLNENVEQYISFVHLDSLSYEEQQYVRTINQRIQPENLTTPITQRVVEKIYPSVFNHKVVLTPALVECIFDDDDFAIQQKRILNLLLRQKNEAFTFLNKLIESKCLSDIITQLVSQWKNFWIHVPAEFLSKPQVKAILPSLIKVENQSEIIISAEDEKLKTLIESEKIDFDKENLDLVAKSKPNTLAYFLLCNQNKFKDIQINDDWLSIIRRGHPNVSDENLKKLEISLWPTSKGYHDVKDKVRPNRIMHHSFFTHDVSDKNFLEVDSQILEAEKGFISIWAWVNQFHKAAKPKYENRYILSHALDGGQKSTNMPDVKYFFPSGWAIHLTNPKTLSRPAQNPRSSKPTEFNCKFFCNKKEEPEDKENQKNVGIQRVGDIDIGWHLFTVAWSKRENKIQFFVDTKEITNKDDDFTYENYWPNEFSGRINIGCWENRDEEKHHFNSKIGPYIFVSDKLTGEMLHSYFMSKPA